MAAPILTADTSLVVPALVGWHEAHRQALAALANVRQLPAQALVESYAVLTRLPRRSLRPAQARQALMHAFAEPPLLLGAAQHQALLQRLSDADMGGGRVYDAVIAATAGAAGARLLTADRRALSTYGLVGVDYQLVEW